MSDDDDALCWACRATEKAVGNLCESCADAYRRDPETVLRRLR